MRSLHDDDRGQTLFDFVVAITMFFLVLIFVVMFLPHLTDPFTSEVEAGSAAESDRIAAQLTHDSLRASGESSYVLDEDCTVEFFDTDADYCEEGVSDRRAIIPINQHSKYNITLRNIPNGSIATAQGTRLATGPTPPDSTEATFQSVRIVSVDGTAYELHVNVW